MRRRCRRNFFGQAEAKFRDEEGLTTISMTVAIFVSMALIFSGAQLYRVESASAEIQEVADACALAAENEVAEYVCAANVCDSIILSFTLLSGVTYGLGIIAALIPIPFVKALSPKLIEVATKTVEARNKFYDTAVSGLNKLQKLLPFLAAANAMGVAQANNSGAMEASYFAVAVLVPETGTEIQGDESDGEDLNDLDDDVTGQIDDVEADADRAEELADEADELKMDAYMADCGRDPDECMYERAASLAGLSGSDNPKFESVDTWTFTAAVDRIKAYYSMRAARGETPEDSSTEAQADAHIRERYIEWVVEELQGAYVVEEEDEFDISLPALFTNTTEMKNTKFYTEAVYPITDNGDGTKTMHAWSGCPNATGAVGMGSVAELESWGDSVRKLCPECKFQVQSVGKVASNMNFDNSFEKHYHEFRELAQQYKEKRDELDPLKKSVKETTDGWFEKIEEIFKDAIGKRLEVDPPGKYGCISLVVNTAQNAADSGFESSFVNSGSTLGTRAAVSAATLIADKTSEGTSVITRIMDEQVAPLFGSLAGIAGIAGDWWSGILNFYKGGVDAILGVVEKVLGVFGKLFSKSGLGEKAADKLEEVISAVGLSPADTNTYMPVLLNTSYVAGADSGTFSATFTRIKNTAKSASSSGTGLMSSVAGAITSNLQQGIDEAWVDIAKIEIGGIGGFTLEMIIPDSVKSAGSGLVSNALSAIRGAIESVGGGKSWE